jgi:hypothetical protein
VPVLPVQSIPHRRELPGRTGPHPLRQQRVLSQPARQQVLGRADDHDHIGVQPDRRRQRSHQHPGPVLPLPRQVVGQLQLQGEPQRGQIGGGLDRAETRQPGDDPLYLLRRPGLVLRQPPFLVEVTDQVAEGLGGPGRHLRP